MKQATPNLWMRWVCMNNPRAQELRSCLCMCWTKLSFCHWKLWTTLQICLMLSSTKHNQQWHKVVSMHTTNKVFFHHHWSQQCVQSSDLWKTSTHKFPQKFVFPIISVCWFQIEQCWSIEKVEIDKCLCLLTCFSSVSKQTICISVDTANLAILLIRQKVQLTSQTLPNCLHPGDKICTSRKFPSNAQEFAWGVPAPCSLNHLQKTLPFHHFNQKISSQKLAMASAHCQLGNPQSVKNQWIPNFLHSRTVSCEHCHFCLECTVKTFLIPYWGSEWAVCDPESHLSRGGFHHLFLREHSHVSVPWCASSQTWRCIRDSANQGSTATIRGRLFVVVERPQSERGQRKVKLVFFPFQSFLCLGCEYIAENLFG